MHIQGKKKIVLLGMMTRMPVAGAVWGTVQYLLGLQRLGFDVYYVEAHGLNPSMLMKPGDEDGTARAAEFVERVMRRFDLEGQWAFHDLYSDGRCYGMSANQLNELYGSAALIINHHGATIPLPEHSATGRLIYLETDPVELEIELFNNDPKAIAFLEPHVAFFTWGLNYGHADCRVPLTERFHFRPSCPVVVADMWNGNGNGISANGICDLFTTVGNYRQWRQVIFQGQAYTWSKHFEFAKFLDVPARTGQGFELALSSFTPEDQKLLESKGWRVRRSLDFSTDLDHYRSYIQHSRGEFTVAKDQNVRLRSGWFSERSAQYLAAGRPVVTQETGFSNALPTGAGLFGFSTMTDVVEAVGAINSDYDRHSRAAQAMAREIFNYDVVLKPMLTHMGV